MIENKVARDGIEPPTPAFSGLRSADLLAREPPCRPAQNINAHSTRLSTPCNPLGHYASIRVVMLLSAAAHAKLRVYGQDAAATCCMAEPPVGALQIYLWNEYSLGTSDALAFCELAHELVSVGEDRSATVVVEKVTTTYR